EKINKSNYKVYCKACVDVLAHTTPEERQKVFDLSNNESTKQSSLSYDTITTSSQSSTRKTIAYYCLYRSSLKVAISEYDIEMYEALYEDFVDTTLTFDG
ncbi:10412_t:CDS:2, partial [Scutellospora calospora]